MKYTFHLEITKPAFDLTTKDERDNLAKQTITDAEKHDLKQGDYAIYHDVTKLRIVVDFPNRKIHMMSAEEYAEAGFPECPHVN